MQNARRIYLYLLSAVGLTVAAVGLWNLLTLAFERISGQLGGSVIGTISEADTRSQLSLALALVAVAGPLWAIHWWFVGRGVRSPVTGEAERTAPIRAFYLALVELVGLGLVLLNGSAVVTDAIRGAIGRPAEFGGAPEGPFAAVLVAAGIWVFHASTRRDDERAGPLEGPADWWPRLAWYALVAGALVMLCSGATELIRTLLDLAVGRSSILGETDPWLAPVAGSFAGILVGGGAWLGLWLGLDRRLRSPGWIGPSERASAVRKAFLAGGIVVGAATTLLAVGSGLAVAMAWLLGAAESTDGARAFQDSVGPPIAIVPFTLVWWWSRRRLLAEGPWAWPRDGAVAARRLSGYASAAVGLAFAAVGAGWLVGFVVDVVLGGERTIIAGSDAWHREVATYLAYVLVGTPVWLWSWIGATRRWAAMPGLEAAATQRRVYLYLVLAAALIASISALALVVYRLFGIVLGATQPSNIVSELSTPVGVIVVGAMIVAYHGLALRTDLALREMEPAATPAPAPTWATAIPVPDTPATVSLAGSAVELSVVVVGPPGADPDEVLATLRAALPTGYGIRPTEAGSEATPD